MSPKIILGSTSPYKRDLLAEVVKDFVVEDSRVDERAHHRSTVEETVRVLSELKAQAVMKNHLGTTTLIITTDVAGELHGEFLGKPDSLEEARRMLRSYSEQEVLIWCGTTVADAKTGAITTHVEKAVVSFAKLSDDMIESYLEEKQPLDKGGAIAIEEIEDRGFVTGVTGEYEAIIGISMQFVKQELKRYSLI